MKVLMQLCIAGLITLLNSCATTQTTDKTVAIGPYDHFSGRLLIMQPANRWQVELDWRGDSSAGYARLTHAASNRIMEIEWLGDHIQLRENQQPVWRQVDEEHLYQQGIIMPPQQLADILNGHLPASLHQLAANRWEGTVRGSYLKLVWQPDQQRMDITDITRGNRLILIIEP